MQAVEFTAHNVRLDDGTLTKPDEACSIEAHPWFVSAQRILQAVFPGTLANVRLADLGCLEGGFAVEFARLGMQVLGGEVRESNLVACHYLKSRLSLPNLAFVRDDAWNIAKHGSFDAVFCCGLLYHFDRPRQFLETLSSVTRKLLILQTHFAPGPADASEQFSLSPICENEGLSGRWFTEFPDSPSFRKREDTKWSSWENHRSFWIRREYLLQAIRDAGFDVVMEQFDGQGPQLAESMLHGAYRHGFRGTFIGIKTKQPA
jgi:SAM-dependent methyltransferase